MLRYRFADVTLAILLILSMASPVFLINLDALTLRIWDEARMASNALEMYRLGNYLVPHFEGQPDMWCTKPPLLIWLQLLFMKWIGVGELAIRLPSALSGLGICILLIIWGKRISNSVVPGSLASLLLVLSPGFVGWHGVRTGDYDILLSWSTTAYLMLFYNLASRDHHRDGKLLAMAFAAIVLAFWVKGVAGLIFLPAVFIHLFIYRKSIFLTRIFWIWAGCAAILALSYYGIREWLNPGYLRAVYLNEIGGRMFSAVEGHGKPFGFYWQHLPERFGIGFPIALAGSILGFFFQPTRRATAFLTLAGSWYLLIISMAKTKLPWYDLPSFPLLALLAGLGIWQVFDALGNKMGNLWFRWVAVIPVLGMMIMPYLNILQTALKPAEYSWDESYYRLSYYLREQIRSEKILEDYLLIDTVYCAHNKFYMNWLNLKGSRVDFAHRARYAQTGKKVIAHQPSVHEYIRSRYAYTLLDSFHNVQVYLVGDRMKHAREASSD